MRSIKLVWHVGYAKTGTTTIQDLAIGIKEIKHIGKFPREARPMRFLNNLANVHNRIFAPHYDNLFFRHTNPHRWSIQSLDKYAQILVKIIEEHQDKSHFFLSDEIITDYRNRVGELNLVYVVYILNRVVELMPTVLIDRIIAVSIREQVSLLFSHYAYDPTINTSFGQWVEDFVTKQQPFLESLKYTETIKYLRNLAGDKIKIKVVPSEILLLDQDTQSYLSGICDYSGSVSVTEKTLNRQNVNSYVCQGKLVWNIQRYKFFFRLIYRVFLELSMLEARLSKNRGPNHYVVKLTYKVFAQLCNLMQTNEKKQRLKLKTVIVGSPSDNECRFVSEYFQEDNKLLAGIIDQKLLEKWGYIHD